MEHGVSMLSGLLRGVGASRGTDFSNRDIDESK